MLGAHRNALVQLRKLKDQMVTALVGAILVFVKHANKERKSTNCRGHERCVGSRVQERNKKTLADLKSSRMRKPILDLIQFAC